MTILKKWTDRLGLAHASPWVAGWVLVVLLTPFITWLSGGQVQAWIISLGVCVQAGAVLTVLREKWTTPRVLKIFMAVLLVTWAAEWVGVSSGIPFGRYAYSALLQPQLGGVPLVVPLAWWMMLPAAWGIANRLAPPSRRVLFAVLSGLAFTSWDLFLDPQMVSFGMWRWFTPGVYFGVPLMNFLGWWLVSSLLTWALHPQDLPVRPLAVIFSLTWILDAMALGLFWGQPGAALSGFFVMGIWVVLFWQREGL